MADGTGLQWDWSASNWVWDPANGPWRPEHGDPATTVRLDISTADIPGREAYDFWRSMVFYNFSAQRPSDEQRRRYQAEGTAFFTAGATLGLSSTDSLFGGRHSAHYRADGMDDITVGYVAEGMRWQVDEDGEHRASAGQFYVYDAARASEVGWSRGGGVYLALPRDVALRSGVSPDMLPNALARMLATSPVAPFLAAQFALLWRRGRNMAAAEMGQLFPAMTALAQAALMPADAAGAETLEPGRLAAACRFIRAHLGDEDLSPDRIAAAVGCSRATLYRLFADHPMTIAEYVRECRLQAAMTSLVSARSGISISAIAARLGFSDPSTFSQAFRRRFGVSPRDVARHPAQSAWPQPRP